MTQTNDKIQKRKRGTGAMIAADYAVAVDAKTGSIVLTLTTPQGAAFEFALDVAQAGGLAFKLDERTNDIELGRLAARGATDRSLITYATAVLHNTVREAGKTCQRQITAIIAKRTATACGDDEFAELIAASADWSSPDRERAVSAAKMIFKGYQPNK